LFQRERRYAEAQQVPWFILSAEQGLVAPDDWLAPSERYLPQTPAAYRSAWGRWVTQRLRRTFLGSVRSTTLGDYDDDFSDTPVADGLRGFRLDLSAAEDEFVRRNRRRPHAYDYLRPSLIPNSTNI
jgi:hypothetical protein